MLSKRGVAETERKEGKESVARRERSESPGNPRRSHESSAEETGVRDV